MTWDPAQYLEYSGERLRPAVDLLARVASLEPRTIVDLGCGAGNVTRILAERWPDARVVGIDNSPAMLAQARKDASRAIVWREADLAAWAGSPLPTASDLVFSNAALHWLDDHEALFPRLFAAVAQGGCLAVQMPSNFAAPSHVELHAVATGAQWRARLGDRARPSPVAPAAQYFDWLAPVAGSIDAWTTEYLHVLPRAEEGDHPVVAWTRGTALTPFLSALDPDEQRAFVADYAARIRIAYPLRADGSVLFPFRRLFIVASKR